MTLETRVLDKSHPLAVLISKAHAEKRTLTEAKRCKALADFYVKVSPAKRPTDSEEDLKENLSLNFIYENLNRVYAVCWVSVITSPEYKTFSICELESIAAYTRSCLIENKDFQLEYPEAEAVVDGFLDFVEYGKMFINADNTRTFITEMNKLLREESERLAALQEIDWLGTPKELASVMRVLTCRLHPYVCKVCIVKKAYGPRDCVSIKRMIEKVQLNIRVKKDLAAYAFVRGGCFQNSSDNQLIPLRVGKFHDTVNPIYYEKQIYLFVALA